MLDSDPRTNASESMRMTRLAFAVLAVATVACGGHKHGPSMNTNINTLWVEVHTRGSHDDALRDGATDGLSRIRFVRHVASGGEIELEGEVTQLDRVGRQNACSVKILIIRLPQHDLLGIADGSARGGSESACIRQVAKQVVTNRISGLLQRRLRAKR